MSCRRGVRGSLVMSDLISARSSARHLARRVFLMTRCPSGAIPQPTARNTGRVAKGVLAASLVMLLSGLALAEGIPCWLRCHCPPKILTPEDVPARLRLSPNPPLRFLDRSTGILTTYLGKMLGIQGWRAYHLGVVAKGKVVHAAGSTDGLYTIDLGIEKLIVGQRALDPPARPNFIRIEVFPLARIGAPLPVREGDQLCVRGPLLWDGDGFLEIHPKKPADFDSINCR